MVTADDILKKVDEEADRYVAIIRTPEATAESLLLLRSAYASGMIRAFSMLAKGGKANA